MTTTLPAMRGLLIDLDGTLYHGSHRINGADTLIHYLQETEMPYRFVTNNSSAAPEEVAARLQLMGIPAEASHVCTSAQAAAAYIANHSPGSNVFVVGEAGLRSAVTDAGLFLTEDKPDYVLQGIDRTFTYERLARAVRWIHEGAVFVMTNPDLLLPSSDGLIPGAGSIGAMLQAAGGKEPVLIGKPSSILMDYSLASIGLAAEEAWVIGDNLATDIAFGRTAGCGSLLVLTGLTTESNFAHYSALAGCEPDVICKDLTELLQYIADHRV